MTGSVQRLRYWIVPRVGRIQVRDLSPNEVRELERQGFERFTIGRGRFAPVVGYAEDPRDVGALRRIFNDQDELKTPPQS